MATKTYSVYATTQTGTLVKAMTAEANSFLNSVVAGIKRAVNLAAEYTYSDDASRVIIADKDGDTVKEWKRNNYTGEWFERKVS